MKTSREEQSVIIINPSNDPEFGGSILNTKQWNRIVIVNDLGKKIAEITSDDVTPATGYKAKLYPTVS